MGYTVGQFEKPVVDLNQAASLAAQNVKPGDMKVQNLLADKLASVDRWMVLELYYVQRICRISVYRR
jgi:hypothetical protein